MLPFAVPWAPAVCVCVCCGGAGVQLLERPGYCSTHTRPNCSHTSRHAPCQAGHWQCPVAPSCCVCDRCCCCCCARLLAAVQDWCRQCSSRGWRWQRQRVRGQAHLQLAADGAGNTGEQLHELYLGLRNNGVFSWAFIFNSRNQASSSSCCLSTLTHPHTASLASSCPPPPLQQTPTAPLRPSHLRSRR